MLTGLSAWRLWFDSKNNDDILLYNEDMEYFKQIALTDVTVQ
jgi:hypothetical protein